VPKCSALVDARPQQCAYSWRDASGRATCRTCRKPIARDSLRYSEEIVIAASDQPGFRNYHLMCAAGAHV